MSQPEVASTSGTNLLQPALELAHTQGRLTIDKETQLFTTEGVAIPAVDDGVLVLIPERSEATYRLIPASNATPNVVVRWEGGEHTFIGNSATLHFDQGDSAASQTPLHLPNGLALTYGQIVALGGDFYGLPNAPISDDPAPPTRFNQAFNSLASQKNSVAEAQAILAIMQTEIDAVNQAIQSGQQASTVYAALGDSLSAKWNVATGGGSWFTDWLPLGRYLQLAATNWDHFGSHAVTAYTIGHGVAIAQAVAAHNTSDTTKKRAQLELAYAMNAFADHFLTDLFSAGHLRTPRKELYQTTTPSASGSYCARYMHDEDSLWGLNVQNGQQQQWIAYGDKKFFDTVNTQNAQIAEHAVQASVDEVYAAYLSGTTTSASQALTYVPNLQQFADPTQTNNFSPMFIVATGTTQRRTNLLNRFDYSWTTNWWGSSTLALLKTIDYLKTDSDEIPIDLAANIVQVWNNKNKTAITVYGPKQAAGYSVAWSNPAVMNIVPETLALLAGDIGGSGQTYMFHVNKTSPNDVPGLNVYQPQPGGGYSLNPARAGLYDKPNTLAWLAGDLTGEGTTSIIQLWDNNSTLGMAVYTPNANNGVDYWSNDNMVQGSGAVAWLTGDMNGDGKTEIFQMWKNQQPNTIPRLGMIVWSPQPGGGYGYTWGTESMGPGPDAVAWLVVDYAGDGRANIAQMCDDGTGKLIINLFCPQPNGEFTYLGGTIPGQGSGAVAWLTGDMTGDGKTDIFQLWDNNGKLGMIIYSPLSTGGYGYAWGTQSLGTSSKALAWFAITAGDTSSTDIVQLSDNNGKLSITVYSLNASSTGYTVSGHKDNIGQTSSAIAWLAANVALD